MARIKNTSVYVFDVVPEVSSFLVGSDQGDGRITKSYRIDALFGLAETEGFIKEAPIDGQPYLRQDGAWELVPASGVGSVFSVFGRTGAVTGLVGDYSSFYSLLGHTHTEAEITDLQAYLLPTDIGSTVQAWSAALDAVSGTNTGDQTTIAGFSSTKAEFNTALFDGTFLFVGDAPTAHTHTESEITDLQSYLLAADIDTLAELNAIITDATLIDTTDSRLSDARTPLAHTHLEADITDLQAYLLSVDMADINATGTPSASTWLRGDGTWGTILGGVSSVFGRTAAVTALVGDYAAFYSQLGHVHDWTDITTGVPTTIAGYGITDFVSLGDAEWAQLVHTHTLSDITDITATAAELNLLDLSGLTAGWVLSADTATTASWKAPAGGGATTLAALTDTTITSATAFDFLAHNGTAWVDRTIDNLGAGSAGVSYDIVDLNTILTVGQSSFYRNTAAGSTNTPDSSEGYLFQMAQGDVASRGAQLAVTRSGNSMWFRHDNGSWKETLNTGMTSLPDNGNTPFVETWEVYGNSGGAGNQWVRIADITGGQADRYKISLTGASGYSSGTGLDGTVTGGVDLYITMGNNAAPDTDNLMVNCYKTAETQSENVVTSIKTIKNSATDYQIWANVSTFASLAASIFSSTGGTYTTYSNTTSATEPAGTINKPIYNYFHNGSPIITPDLITANAGMLCNGDLTLTTGDQVLFAGVDERVKLSVWSGTGNPYGIGMGNSYTLGGLNGFAMSFQMNSTAGRGWWWGHSSDTNAQGAMSLNNAGELQVSGPTRINYDNSTVAPITSGIALDVSGEISGTTLRATSTGDASLGGTAHGFQVGLTTSTNMIIDNNEIMARNNGAAGTMEFQREGGVVNMFGATAGTLIVALGSLRMNDNVELAFGNSAGESEIRSNGIHTLWDSQSTAKDIIFQAAGVTKFTFNMGTASGSAVDWIATSDERLKDNIKPLNTNPIEAPWVQWNWKDNGEYHIGLVAQELEKTHPEYVTEGEDGIKAVSMNQVFVNKIAHLEDKVERLEFLVEELLKDRK